MQLRKRDEIKKNIEVVINKDKNIIWNIDFNNDKEIYIKPPENLYESIEFYLNKYEENLKKKGSNFTPSSDLAWKKNLKKLAKKLIKVKKIKLGEIAQKVVSSKNNLKLWFKNKLTETEEISKIDSAMKIWVLMEMNTLNAEDLNSLVLKYFKQENSESSPKASDSQEMIKNLLNTFFPKNKQINKKSYFHSLTKLNGIWLHNKPPKNHSIYSKKYNSLHELIPISINIIYEEIYFQEVILWDNQKTEIHEILTFSFLYLQDLMKEKEKFNIEKKNLESLSLKLAKEILFQIEEYEVLTSNIEILMNFQMCNTHASIIDNVISISLKVRDEEFKYAETFEWEITCANMPNVEIFINNLCEDLDFPESIKRELLIQMKLQIFHYLKTRFKKMLSTFQNILPAENQDLSLDSFDKREEDNFLKKTLNEQKRKFSGSNLEDFRDLKQELAHSFTESLPMVPKNYEPFDETYYLQKNELYQFLEKNLNFLSINQKKIIDTHSSFYKGFMSLVQHSRNQSQRIPSENRILNYKNFDKSIPERQPQINGMNKPTYFPNMNMNKLEENEKENEKVEPTVKSISGPQAFNTFLQLSSNDYSQKYSYPYHKENNNNNFNSIPNLNKPPIQNQNFPGQVMTRSFQNQTQLNQFLALRNNFKQSPHSFQDTSPQIPNLNVYGNQMKIAHNLNSNLYSFQSNYPKYHQNIYINNSSMRVNNTNLQNEANNFGDDIQGKYVEENGYKNFSYLPDHIPKKMNATFYPNNNEASMYYKNLEVHRENNEYLSNGYTNINTDNNRNSMNINGNSEEINLNDYSTFEKKYDNKNEGLNLEENYLASEHDEFKIKRINSMTKFNGQKQFEDFIANNPENRINFND